MVYHSTTILCYFWYHLGIILVSFLYKFDIILISFCYIKSLFNTIQPQQLITPHLPIPYIYMVPKRKGSKSLKVVLSRNSLSIGIPFPDVDSLFRSLSPVKSRPWFISPLYMGSFLGFLLWLSCGYAPGSRARRSQNPRSRMGCASCL